MDLSKGIRLIVPYPHQLFQTVGRTDSVTGNVVKLLLGDPGGQVIRLFDSPLIRPDDSVSKKLPLFSQADTSHHLAAE